MTIQLDDPEAILLGVGAIILAGAQLARTFWARLQARRQLETNAKLDELLELMKRNGREPA